MEDKNNSSQKHEYDKKQGVNHENMAMEFEKIRQHLDTFKKNILKKYPFTIAIGVIPLNANNLFEEDESIPKEEIEKKLTHIMMLIPEEEYKNISKIKPEAIKLIRNIGQNFWIHIKTPVDLWNYGLDSKFEFLDAISASLPIYDKGFLGALRVANIHKSLVLRKFEKYVASYVIGGSLVRGTAGKDSDVDTFVIIDDTDVKRMPRIELREKLRGMIYDYIREATALAGVKNILNVQVYLLTDFWESVKDAHPVMFTFIRDGIPLYDRGTFIPWKLLLQLGRIKPSPEAVDMFMKSGDQTKSIVDRRLIDAMVDIYLGIVTPTQALMMLAGEAPPVPKTIVEEVRKVLVEKEKLMNEKDLAILKKAVGLYKDYEHGKLKTISGREIDELMKDSEIYNKRMKELRKKIELRMQEHLTEKIYNEIFGLLGNIFGENSYEQLINKLDSELIKRGKLQPRMLEIAKEIAKVKKKNVKEMSQSEMQRISRDASDLINALIEYSQRKELVSVEKGIIQISYAGGRKADLVLTDSDVFLASLEGVKKIECGKLVKSSREELEKALKNSKGILKFSLSSEAIETLKKELGEFEILF